MNIAVWIVQILVGLLFVAQGVYMHGFGADQVKTRQGMHGLAPSLGHG